MNRKGNYEYAKAEAWINNIGQDPTSMRWGT